MCEWHLRAPEHGKSRHCCNLICSFYPLVSRKDSLPYLRNRTSGFDGEKLRFLGVRLGRNPGREVAVFLGKWESNWRDWEGRPQGSPFGLLPPCRQSPWPQVRGTALASLEALLLPTSNHPPPTRRCSFHGHPQRLRSSHGTSTLPVFFAFTCFLPPFNLNTSASTAPPPEGLPSPLELSHRCQPHFRVESVPSS